MSIRPGQEKEDVPAVEVMARADRLLSGSHRVSNLVSFEPVNILDVRRIGKQLIPQVPSRVTRETEKVDVERMGQSLHNLPYRRHFDEVRSLRSDVGGDQGALADNLSEIPDAVDLGTNVFITYFLHAVEVERLIVINKEQLDEAIDMEKEIEGLEIEIDALRKDKLKHKDELQTMRDHLAKYRTEIENTRVSSRLELQETIAREKSVQLSLMSKLSEEEQNRELEVSRRLRQELITKGELSGDTELRLEIRDVTSRHERQLEEIKSAMEENVQRELLALHGRLQAQYEKEMEKVRRQITEKDQEQITAEILKMRNESLSEKKQLEAQLRQEAAQEYDKYKQKISILIEEVDQLKERLRNRTPQKNGYNAVNYDMISNIGSDIASHKSGNPNINRRDLLSSPKSIEAIQNVSQRIQGAQKYHPLMARSHSKQHQSKFQLANSHEKELEDAHILKRYNPLQNSDLSYIDSAKEYLMPSISNTVYPTPQYHQEMRKRSSIPFVEHNQNTYQLPENSETNRTKQYESNPSSLQNSLPLLVHLNQPIFPLSSSQGQTNLQQALPSPSTGPIPINFSGSYPSAVIASNISDSFPQNPKLVASTPNLIQPTSSQSTNYLTNSNQTLANKIETNLKNQTPPFFAPTQSVVANSSLRDQYRSFGDKDKYATSSNQIQSRVTFTSDRNPAQNTLPQSSLYLPRPSLASTSQPQYGMTYTTQYGRTIGTPSTPSNSQLGVSNGISRHPPVTTSAMSELQRAKSSSSYSKVLREPLTPSYIPSRPAQPLIRSGPSQPSYSSHNRINALNGTQSRPTYQYN